MKLCLPVGFTITAHTGCENTKNNSLESIICGAENGADVVEFDIMFDIDNMPVLSHDKPSGSEVTIDEAFALLSSYKKLKANIDIKSTNNLAIIQQTAKKYNITDRIFYTGVFEDFVEKVRTDSPDISYYLNLSVKSEEEQTAEYLNDIVNKVIQNGAVGINLNKNGSSLKLCDHFHKHELKVSVWTVDDENEMTIILSHHPDNITTCWPSKLKRIINGGNRNEIS